MLLEELDKKAAEREAELRLLKDEEFFDVLGGWAQSIGELWLDTFIATPKIPGQIVDALGTFQKRRGDRPLWIFFASVLASIAGGLAAGKLAGRLVRRHEEKVFQAQPRSLGHWIKLLALRFFLQSVRLMAFTAVGLLINRLINKGVPPDLMTGRFLVEASAYTILAGMVAGFVLAPVRSELRLCSVDDASARFLTYRIMMIFGWSTFGIGFLIWCYVFGLPPGAGMGFWVSLIFYGLIALTLWQGRRGITSMVIGDGQSGPRWEQFAQAWPKIAMGIVMGNWLIVQLFVATGHQQSLSLAALNMTMIVILTLPMFEVALPALVRAIWPGDPDANDGLRAAHTETQAGLMRISRIQVTVVTLFLLAGLRGLNLYDVASQGVGALFAGALIEIFVMGMVAFGLWELMNIVADRQMAIERVTLGADEGEEQEGEGGQGGTRLGTLMPLVRGAVRVAILLLTILAILGQLGINITPLLAGAGVIGLAISFGAQALMRDVLSGIFFLIDDAFRKGEYIELGEVRGSVESISIRSMQLRHHKGPLHTIPFGEIKYLTNYSRDWVIMKLPLRVTYDTDVEKLRKLIKKLGQDLLVDPELVPKFLAPLKSQGVIQMEDSAMIVRIKFMTKPGDQWTLRTKVFARIRELFEREGIKFAHREVTVHIANDPKSEGMPVEAQQVAASAAARAIYEDETLPPKGGETR